MDINKLLEKKQTEKKGKIDTSLPKDTADNIINTVREISLSLIIENENQPRKDYDAEKIKAMAASIKEKGLIQPVIIKPDGKGYVMIAGHRRFRAYKLLNKPTIPCIVKEENLSSNDLTELALVENLQREDLNALEISESLYQLKELRNINQKEIAVVTGYSEGNISKYIQLYEAVKDNDGRKEKVRAYGFKKAYHYFCNPEKRNKKRKEYRAGSRNRLLIEIQDEKNREEIQTAIKKTEEFLTYLKGLIR